MPADFIDEADDDLASGDQLASSDQPAYTVDLASGDNLDVDYNLDIVGVLEGTDKSSAIGQSWDYLRKYQALFGHLRDDTFNLIEIGVAHGASTRMWRSFFRNAHIIGIDVQPACKRHASDRVTIEIGSQDDPELLARVCAEYPPTIIIDDGSHLAHHVVYTFERMDPALLPGGFYVVEDMNFHSAALAERYRNDDAAAPLDYFGHIVRSRMAKEAPRDGQHWGTQKYVFDNTESVTVIDSAVILRKRQPGGAIETAERFADRYIAANTLDGNFHGRLAEYYRRHWGPTDQAESAARKAMETNPDDAHPVRQLADLLVARGRIEEAAVVAQLGADRFPQDAAQWMILGRIRGRMADHEAAEEAFRQAIDLNRAAPQSHYQLSVTLERQGRLQEALRSAEQAAALGANDNSAAELSRHLAKLRAKVG